MNVMSSCPKGPDPCQRDHAACPLTTHLPRRPLQCSQRPEADMTQARLPRSAGKSVSEVAALSQTFLFPQMDVFSR